MRKHSAYSAANWLAARRRGGDGFTRSARRLGDKIPGSADSPPADGGVGLAELPWLTVRYVNGQVLTDEDVISEEIEDVGGGVRIRGEARTTRLNRDRRAGTRVDRRKDPPRYNRRWRVTRCPERKFKRQEEPILLEMWRLNNER